MNIQDVINKALSDNTGIAVTELREDPVVEDSDITKLAAALNFIGTNLEHSVPSSEEVLAQAALTEEILEKEAFLKSKKRKALEQEMLDSGMSEQEISKAFGSTLGNVAKGTAKGTLGAMGGALAGGAIDIIANKSKLDDPDTLSTHLLEGGGALIGGGLGLRSAQKGRMARGRKALSDHQSREAIKANQTKQASVDEALYEAAKIGKNIVLEKLAEDRINPARISAGPADPYSGEIMPNPGAVSSEFVGSSRTPKALIDLKAQKVRDRINSDMKKYVKNVGDGYNMQSHLSKFNK